jgi:phenylacetic acid degradation operon negative regulatory protein
MWLSPHDREREVVTPIDELEVGGYAGVMVGRPAAGLDFRALVSQAWDLDALDERYLAFMEEFSPSAEAGTPRGMDERQAFLLRTRLVHVFRRFPALDPELPDELMHAPRHRAEAVALFHNLYAALAPTAQRHFDAVTSAP